MAGLLSGLSSLGLGNLENASIYEEPKEEQGENIIEETPEQQEKNLVYDRGYECPVCDAKITSKVMKTGKAKLLSTDTDLRPVYEGIDAQKYDVVSCEKCGFSALSRYFKPMTNVQVKLIQKNISKNIKMKPYTGEIYTYEEALERYKLALACAVVRQSKSSEKAYICLKSGWLLRGWQEELETEEGNTAKIKKLKEQEKEYLINAMDGFINAKATELFPMCGMDENTVDYIIAVLAYDFEKYDVASKLIASILTSSSAGVRMKDRTRDLKDALLADLKRKKGRS